MKHSKSNENFQKPCPRPKIKVVKQNEMPSYEMRKWLLEKYLKKK